MKREDILHEAEKAICYERKNVYGGAEDCFEDIANLWAMYLGDDAVITRTDVAVMLILMKVARAKANPLHMDSWVDICGYAAIAAELAEKEYGHIVEEDAIEKWCKEEEEL